MNPSLGPVGVLALQGDFHRHQQIVASLGVDSLQVRTREDLWGTSALVIPGGESTTIAMGVEREALAPEISAYAAEGRPVFGTCAGMVLLSNSHLGLLDLDVERNAYGRQVHSFETDLTIAGVDGNPLRALFIRAPMVTRVGDGVEVLAELDGSAVMVRSGSVSAISFHPELIGDSRVHELALGLSPSTSVQAAA